MSNKWHKTNLGLHTDIFTGFPFKSKHYVEEGIRLLRGDNIAQGSLRWDKPKFWSTDHTTKLDEYFLEAGDVILAMDRPWIEAGLKFAKVSNYDLPILLVQRVARLRGLESLDTQYLYYLIANHQFTHHVLAVQTGTAVPHISSQQIAEFEFLLPPLEEQREIANILSSFDDKIEANRRENETLEAIAHAIFKSWFVDFDPVHAKANGESPVWMDAETADLFPDSFEDSELGMIPSSWKYGEITELADVIMGQSPPGDTYNEIGDGTPLVNGPVEFGSYFLMKRKWTTAHTRLSALNDLILCVRGSTTGRTSISDDVYCLGRGVCAIRSKNIYNCQEYVNQSVELSLVRLLSRTTGSVFPNLSSKAIRSFEVLIADKDLINQYTKIVRPMFKQIWENEKQNETLAETRDALLPRLISGELRVGEM